jgi:hypothetical protein
MTCGVIALMFSANLFAADLASDTVDVQHVMDAYHEAVVNHDGARMIDLFLPQASLWLNVLSDEAYAAARLKSPDAAKVRHATVAAFANLVSTTRSNFNPTHTQLHVDSDGTIAAVYLGRWQSAESWQRSMATRQRQRRMAHRRHYVFLERCAQISTGIQCTYVTQSRQVAPHHVEQLSRLAPAGDRPLLDLRRRRIRAAGAE